MKGISIIHKVLLALTILAALFCGWMAVQFFFFPVEEYEDAAAQALSHAEVLGVEKAELEVALVRESVADQKAISQARLLQTELIKQRDNVRLENEQKKEQLAEAEKMVASLDNMQQLIVDLRTEYGETIRQLEDMIVAGESDVKICYLTLDDGPTGITDRFITKLDELDVYATFFTIGSNGVRNKEELLRQEMMGGHTIANHSHSHAHDTGLYFNLNNFTEEVQKQDEMVYEATGFHTNIFRFPCGSYYCYFRDDAIEWLESNGYQWIDWSANAYDSGAAGAVAGKYAISSSMIAQCKTMDICVLLAHDWNIGTLEALDIAVPKLREAGYVFLPLFPQSLTMGAATRSNFG